MKKETIFKKLEVLGVLPHHISELKIYMMVTSAEPNIGICITIHSIIDQYNDTPERENEVYRLLANLLKIHFR